MRFGRNTGENERLFMNHDTYKKLKRKNKAQLEEWVNWFGFFNYMSGIKDAEASGDRVKTWAEAQKEIAAGMTRTWFKGCLGEPVSKEDYGKPCAPMWTTPEIAAAVDSYGFDNLCRALESDMPIVWAQLRKAYEAATTRKAEKEINEPLLDEFKLIAQSVKLIN